MLLCGIYQYVIEHGCYDIHLLFTIQILDRCMQRENYDIGEEAVQRFSLPAEDKASLELAEWVAGAYKRALVCLLMQSCQVLDFCFPRCTSHVEFCCYLSDLLAGSFSFERSEVKYGEDDICYLGFNLKK
jgi:hypothetical protein